jgi:protein phosphatase
MQYIVGSGQSVGLQSDHNEDALFTLSSVLSDGKTEEPFGLYIIADGMGGHRNGEIASSVAIRVVVRYVIDQLYKILLEPQQNMPSLRVQ